MTSRRPNAVRIDSLRNLLGIVALLFALLMPGISGCGNVLFEVSGVITEHVVANQNDDPDQEGCLVIPNRCGPLGVLGIIVPDCPRGTVCFVRACNRHDLCYGTCGADRRECDDRFYADLTDACVVTLIDRPPRYLECLGLAYIYWQVVVRFGEFPFEVTQDRICGCEDQIQATADSLVLIPVSRPAPSAADASSGRFRDSSVLRARVPPFQDADDDLMPDEWEKALGLDPTDPYDALIDSDGDGFRNLEKYLRGIRPGDFDPPAP